MGNIKWINGINKEDHRIFGSEFEAYEWADGLHADIAPELGNVDVGYATPDKKVYSILCHLIPLWVKDNELKVIIHNEEIEEDGQPIYKIWW